MRISFTVIPGKTITCTLRIQVTVINDNLHAERTGHRLHIEGGGKINVSGHTGFPCVCLYTVDYACSHGNKYDGRAHNGLASRSLSEKKKYPDRIHDRINDGKENRLESGESGAGGGVERVGQRAQNTGQQQEEKSAGI